MDWSPRGPKEGANLSMFGKKTSLALAMAVAGCIAAPAQAALKKWAHPLSGAFATDDQWSAVGKPRRADSVLFDLSSAYSVRFAGHQVNSRLVVGDDKLVLRLDGGRYSLTSTRLDALVMGRRAGDTSRLTVRDGMLATPRAVVGGASGARAHLTLNNAIWNTSDSLVVGNAGAASMTAITRSTINSTSATLGAKQGSKGNVMLSGRGTVWNISDSLTVAPQGGSLIAIRPGAALNIGRTLDLRESGVIRLQGGSLKADSLLAGGRLDLDSGTFDVANGTLGSGASLVVIGGKVHFGTGSPSSLDFDGDVEFVDTGSLVLNIGADGQHDLLNITGTAMLNDVVIRLDPNYAGPEVFLPLINAAKLTYGGEITLDAGGRRLDLVQTGQTLGVVFSPIPEPATLSLLAAGAILGLLRRRRRIQ